MIPDNLKPGAVLRVVTWSAEGREVVLKGYNPRPSWGATALPTCKGALIEGYPNSMYGKDQGWHLSRFDVVRDGDGADYQAPDDIDLQPEGVS